MYAQYIRETAEIYGFSPKEVGKLTVYQLSVLYAKDGAAAKQLASGIKTTTVSDYATMSRSERRRIMLGHG